MNESISNPRTTLDGLLAQLQESTRELSKLDKDKFDLEEKRRALIARRKELNEEIDEITKKNT